MAENRDVLSDQRECTTADCGRIAVRMVEIEDLGEHPYCYFCAAALDPQKLGDEIDRLRAENVALDDAATAARDEVERLQGLSEARSRDVGRLDDERRALRAENEKLRADLGRRDDFLYQVRKTSAEYEGYLAGLALAADETNLTTEET